MKEAHKVAGQKSFICRKTKQVLKKKREREKARIFCSQKLGAEAQWAVFNPGVFTSLSGLWGSHLKLVP
jgi:hypothetical protein